IDIRGMDIKEVNQETKSTFIRVGVFDALERAGFTTEAFREQLEKDREVIQAQVGDFEGKQLLFSPFQELSSEALGFVFMRATSAPFDVVKPSPLIAYDEVETEHYTVTLIDGQTI